MFFFAATVDRSRTRQAPTRTPTQKEINDRRQKIGNILGVERFGLRWVDGQSRCRRDALMGQILTSTACHANLTVGVDVRAAAAAASLIRNEKRILPQAAYVWS